MKMHVIIDKQGQLVAATQGQVGPPKDLASQLKGTNGKPIAFIVPDPGHTVRDVDVPDNLTDVTKADEFHKFLLQAIGR
jgi:hypothetical protein